MIEPIHGQGRVEPAPRIRAAVAFALLGDVRHLSHHDELRMLARSLRRADWPLAYSQGFNPQPRIVIPLPRSTGVASTSELALVELSEARPASELAASLAGALPAGVRLTRVYCPLPTSALHATTVEYAVDCDEQELRAAEAGSGALLGSASRTVTRSYGSGRPSRDIDVRPFVREICIEPPRIRMRLGFDGDRSARPGEVLECLGLRAEGFAHRTCRAAVEWDFDLSGAPSATPDERM